jgi:predicted RNase H-like nuclease (RuvC/YqgF family)
MHKIKVEITTDNGVLEAGKVLDVKKHLKPKEIKELESAGYIEVYNEDVNSEDNGVEKIKELETTIEGLNTQIGTLTTTNEELNNHIVEANKKVVELEATIETGKNEAQIEVDANSKTIKELEAKVEELSKATPSTKATTKPGTKK